MGQHWIPPATEAVIKEIAARVADGKRDAGTIKITAAQIARFQQ